MQKNNTSRNNNRRRDTRGDPSGWSTISRRKENKYNGHYRKHSDTIFSNRFGTNTNKRKPKDTFDFPRLSEGFVQKDTTEKSTIPWISIITRVGDVEDPTDVKSEDATQYFNAHSFIHKRKCVRNQVPHKNSNGSYDVWEHVYHKYLLELFNIFVDGMEEFDIYTNQEKLFKIFCLFIRDCSSGEISPYI